MGSDCHTQLFVIQTRTRLLSLLSTKRHNTHRPFGKLEIRRIA